MEQMLRMDVANIQYPHILNEILNMRRIQYPSSSEYAEAERMYKIVNPAYL